MSFRFGDVPVQIAKPRPVNPIELYTSLKRTDPGINDLWLAQGDVLRKWHERRTESDVTINLNTGAGKTYVGLLIGQSLSNETQRRIIYACASIQLVDQTANKANGYGLEVTTYTAGSYSNTLSARGEAVLVTTYQTLFNGKSRRFRDGSVAGIIFDDAHTAESLIRDCYTLTILRDEYGEGYEALAAIFASYFDHVDQSNSFAEIVAGSSSDFKLVPPFIIANNLVDIRNAILALDLQSGQRTMFAWEWLRDRLDLGAWFITSNGISITPAYLPIDIARDFGVNCRRIYLSATLQAPDAFLKTFGIACGDPITAETAAGASERLIVFPPDGTPDAEQESRVAEAVAAEKTLVLVPSKYAKAQWDEKFGTGSSSDDVVSQIDDFKEDEGPAKLVLANRYDGVDLPGNTCRVMVLSGLPIGTSLCERYLFEQLGLLKGLRSTIASRLTQSFGRIFRGMSDYGIVLLAGNKLTEWLETPQYRSMLPDLLQKQLVLGRGASMNMRSVDDTVAALRAVLTRDGDWSRYYDRSMDEIHAEHVEPQEAMLELANAEHSLGLALWRRDLAEAIRIGEHSRDNVASISAASGSWFMLWLGTAYILSGNPREAEHYFSRARGLSSNIPRMPPKQSGQLLDPQMKNIVEIYYNDEPAQRARLLRQLAQLARSLASAQVSSKITEESLRLLGYFLGLESTRPDHEFSTGPDVLWSLNGDNFLGLEAKTDKTETSCYQKRELGQVDDHIRWLRQRHVRKQIEVLLVGPHIPACDGANPNDQFNVVDLNEFARIAEALRDAINKSYQTYTPITFSSECSSALEKAGLRYANLLLGLPRWVVPSS
jgi:hypothetical protein